jgi:hypothetical protein
VAGSAVVAVDPVAVAPAVDGSSLRVRRTAGEANRFEATIRSAAPRSERSEARRLPHGTGITVLFIGCPRAAMPGLGFAATSPRAHLFDLSFGGLGFGPPETDSHRIIPDAMPTGIDPVNESEPRG